jgi:hypothetical protein
MSEISKQKLMKAKNIDPEIADVLEAAGLITPRDIKLADDADLEAAGLTEEEIQKVRSKCPAFKPSHE